MNPLHVYQLFNCLTNYTVVLPGGQKSTTSDSVCTTPGCVKAAATLLDFIDPETEPCDDFYRFSCGKWLDNHAIPDDRTHYSSLSETYDSLQQKIRIALEEESSGESSNAERVARAIYAKCMDIDAHEAEKSVPLWDLLNELGGFPLLTPHWKVNSDGGLEQLLGSLQKELGYDDLFSAAVEFDAKNSSRYMLQIGEAGLGLTHTIFYLNRTLFGRFQDAYKDLMRSLIVLVAQDNNATLPSNFQFQLEEIFDFEAEIAKIKRPLAEARNLTASHNVMQLSDILQTYSWFDWLSYFKLFLPEDVISTFDDKTTINVQSPEYVHKMGALIAATPPRIVYNYVIWGVILSHAGTLDERFVELSQKFDQLMTGRKVRPHRWKTCINMAKVLGKAVGALYVRGHFANSDREEAMKIIEKLKESFKGMLDESSWMDQETAAKAKLKVDTIINNVGFDKYTYNATAMDEYYKDLTFDETKKPFEAVREFLRWLVRYSARNLLQPVEKEGLKNPAVLNAFYNPSLNAITFPAGILQPPVFRGDFPKSINYGSLGSVIGHEITHGFDDQGKKHDKFGNMENWWSSESESAFKTKKQCIVDQYSSYVVPEINMNINGQLTQGENIADNGGLKMSYRAFQTYKKTEGISPKLPGLEQYTDDQIFFISYANVISLKC